VGKITIIDRDVVEEGNLHRQLLYSQEDAALGLPKVEAAARRLAAINRDVEVCPIAMDVGPALEPLEEAIRQPGTVLIDGTDNFETRYVLNDLCVQHGVPMAYAGVLGARATQATFVPGLGPCLACLSDDVPLPGTVPTCETAGVFPPAVVIVGGAQASDAMKHLGGLTVSTSLLSFDLLRGTRSRVDLARAKREDCPCCVRREFVHVARARSVRMSTALCGQRAVQVVPGAHATIDLRELAARLQGAAEVRASALAISVRPIGAAWEMSVFADGRAIVRGETDSAKARAIYARYVGL
jgi:adenylyltransferase/sulfurtransferase